MFSEASASRARREHGSTAPSRGVARFAWALLGYEILVVAWGAYVRATGSGAGCGRHWPTCNGEILPRAPRIETLIEMSHRLSSGGALIGTLVLFVWAVRVYPRGHRVRRGAGVTTLLMVAEALIGAALVLFELVAHDASMKRALSISLHLINTFLLLASTATTAWWASGGGRGAPPGPARGRPRRDGGARSPAPCHARRRSDRRRDGARRHAVSGLLARGRIRARLRRRGRTSSSACAPSTRCSR